MRIIAGLAKGRRLKGPPGRDTRPMTDRAREGLFSSLGSIVEGASVLDLFAGSGSLGLEALSRGAGRAVFVERNRAAIGVLEANIQAVGLGGEVHHRRVEGFLEGMPELFDLVFVDPPYAMRTAEVEAVLATVVAWTAPGGVVILHRRRGEPDPELATNLAVDDIRSYGGTHLIRYRREDT